MLCIFSKLWEDPVYMMLCIYLLMCEFVILYEVIVFPFHPFFSSSWKYIVFFFLCWSFFVFMLILISRKYLKRNLIQWYLKILAY